MSNSQWHGDQCIGDAALRKWEEQKINDAAELKRLRAVIETWMPTLLAWANPVPGDVVSPSEMHIARALLTAIGV